MKKYEELVQDIISKICQNVIDVKLPSERELAEKYDISRFSVRKALSKLEAIGIVKSKVGSGYFVNTSIIGSPLIYNSVTENKFGEISYKKIKLNKRLPTTHEMQMFSIEENEYVWVIKRLRLIQGKVTQVEETKLPVNMFPKVNNEIIESSLQKYVLSLGLEIDSYLTSYRAINVSKEDAELLNCKRNSSAMNITNRGFLKNGEVFIVSDIIDIPVIIEDA
ncbi:GntR family transcriptional regulator [Vibrio vulnificus]|uniref:GntR family transcriptional regulator n=1 Tax=Vibrio vulnificus TaxID=672 RepID=UPI00051DC1DA|nr:GntR family transcriptional regulator [Vibrio vulnificus]ASJ41519.1 GntR family transcriptional regulator [Vibrio vulnificus]KGK68155.1 GntR family transcriptional regulator [Vibrio vulnificus]POB73388.1 GntR family transcriptional regulator [Vibrio vulnificus]POB75838.1 GntR family transcriptional regulator [Vibrio vulnificus]POB76457.1 GntR family transcriptional regulator [Vibrio vulnificus]